MMDLRRAYSSLNMPPSRYLLLYALPLVGAGAIVVLIFQFIVPQLLTGVFGLVIYAIPLYFLILAIVYPYTVAEGKKHVIDNNIHFFVTHMGVLATSNIPRADMLRILSSKEEYGALAQETRKIFTLVDSWNMSLSEACRFIAKRTPSEIFSDFLDRFAYSMESGEDLETYLKNEQVVIMEDYASLYRSKLYEVEAMKDIFNSLMMSVIFLVIFAILMPIITGLDPMLLMGGVMALVLFIEVTAVYFTKAKAPTDPIWHSLKIETELERKVKKSLPISLVFCFLLTILMLNFNVLNLPFSIVLAIGITPLLVTGMMVAKEEEKVKRRDDNYAAFIRSLGASASARGGAVKEVLRHLQHHDFGPLTDNIRNLYSRLTLRVDDEMAWQHFSAECGSNLIEKFSRMFVEGIKAGGKADQIGRIISDNFVHMVALRKERYQTAASFRGLLYGLIAGMAFALFVGVGIVSLLQGIFQDVSIPTEGPGAMFASFTSADLNVELMAFMVLIILLLHSLSSSLMIRVADGGNFFRSYADMVGLFWVASLVSVLSQNTLNSLL